MEQANQAAGNPPPPLTFSAFRGGCGLAKLANMCASNASSMHGEASLTNVQRHVIANIHCFNALKACRCCARHQSSRPVDIHDMPLPYELNGNDRGNNCVDCECSCRHQMRWICRSFYGLGCELSRQSFFNYTRALSRLDDGIE
jgi:hypothetical protein